MAGDSAIGALAVRIGADATELLETFSKAGKASQGFGGAVDQLQGKLLKLGVALSPVAVAAWVRSMADVADQAGKTAQKVGMTVEALSQLQYAAKLADVGNDQLTVGLVHLSKSMLDARQQFSEAGDVFRALGVTVKEGVGGPLRDTESVVLDLADRFAKMKDGADKTALAVKIFGRSGAEMVPLLNMGSEGLKQNAEEARKFGVVISTQAAKEAEAFNDNLRRLKASSEGLSMQLAGPLVKALGDASGAMLKAKQDGEGFFESWKRGLSELLTGDDVYKWSKELVSAEENLRQAQNQLDRVKHAAQSDNGKLWPEEAARGVAKYTANLAAAQAEVDRLMRIKPVLFKPEDEKPKGGTGAAPRVIDSKAASEREQEVRDAMHRVRIADDERELAQIALQNKRREELRLHALAADQDIAMKMAARMANPMQDDESNQSRDPAGDARQLRLLEMKEGMKSAEQLENEAYKRRLADLKGFTDAELDLVGGRLAAEQQLSADHYDRLVGISNRGLTNLADFKKANWKDQTKHMVGELVDMTAAAANHNRGMFEINKVASIAQAIMKGWVAVQNSFAFGTEWGGPVGGYAMASIAAAATLVNIQAIRSTTFGGGTSPSASFTPAPAVTPVSAGGGNNVQGQTTVIQLKGLVPLGQNVLDSVNESLRNGGRLVLQQ